MFIPNIWENKKCSKAPTRLLLVVEWWAPSINQPVGKVFHRCERYIYGLLQDPLNDPNLAFECLISAKPLLRKATSARVSPKRNRGTPGYAHYMPVFIGKKNINREFKRVQSFQTNFYLFAWNKQQGCIESGIHYAPNDHKPQTKHFRGNRVDGIPSHLPLRDCWRWLLGFLFNSGRRWGNRCSAQNPVHHAVLLLDWIYDSPTCEHWLVSHQNNQTSCWLQTPALQGKSPYQTISLLLNHGFNQW